MFEWWELKVVLFSFSDRKKEKHFQTRRRKLILSVSGMFSCSALMDEVGEYTKVTGKTFRTSSSRGVGFCSVLPFSSPYKSRAHSLFRRRDLIQTTFQFQFCILTWTIRMKLSVTLSSASLCGVYWDKIFTICNIKESCAQHPPYLLSSGSQWVWFIGWRAENTPDGSPVHHRTPPPQIDRWMDG